LKGATFFRSIIVDDIISDYKTPGVLKDQKVKLL